MNKIDMLHMFIKNEADLQGLDFVANGKTSNNEEPKDSRITFVSETAITTSSNLKLKKKRNLNDDELYMITFLNDNVEKLYKKFQDEKIKCSKPKRGMRRNILGIPCKTKFKYMYLKPFAKSKLTFCFREIDRSSDLLAYQKAMVPNAASKDITGVKEVKIFDDFTAEDYTMLSKFFDKSYIDGEEFSAEIYQNQTLTLIGSDEKKYEVTLDVRGKAFKGKELPICEESKIKFIY